MRRKLVKQGPSTLTVSMPSDWVKANHLEPGQEVVLTIDQNKIVIAPQEVDREPVSVSLDVQKRSPTSIKHLLHAAHKKGYDELRLQVLPNQIEEIQHVVEKQLLGFEIVEQTANQMIVRFVTRIDVDELKTLLRRTFLVTLSLAEALTQEQESYDEFLTLEESNNRLTNYCERIIVRNLFYESDAIFKYIIVWILEKMADVYKLIIKRAKRVEKSEAVLCHEMLKDMYQLYYRYSPQAHDSLIERLGQAKEYLQGKNSVFEQVIDLITQTHGALIALSLQNDQHA